MTWLGQTEDHKGLPYYTTMHVIPALYSREDPCGLPLVSDFRKALITNLEET